MTKRISFDDHHAAHLYELAAEHFCDGDAGCFTCTRLRERLEAFLDPKEVRAIRRNLKKRGYCNKLTKKPL